MSTTIIYTTDGITFNEQPSGLEELGLILATSKDDGLLALALESDSEDTGIRTDGLAEVKDAILIDGQDASAFIGNVAKQEMNVIENMEDTTVTLTEWNKPYHWGFDEAVTPSIVLPTPSYVLSEYITIYLLLNEGDSVDITAPNTCRISDMTTGYATISLGNTYTITCPAVVGSQSHQIYKITCTVIGNGLICVDTEHTTPPLTEN